MRASLLPAVLIVVALVVSPNGCVGPVARGRGEFQFCGCQCTAPTATTKYERV